MRTVFFGTPEIAIASLDALADTTDLVGVVCQPDRPAGRGMSTKPPAVKRRALELGLEVYQPEKVRSGELEAWLRVHELDLAVVLAYGRILPQQVLDAPRLGCVNLHASLLPRHRGAAPIQACLLQGDPETGVCLMQMEAGLDTGPVFARRTIPIAADEDTGSLTARLATLAAELLSAEIEALGQSRLTAVPQEESLATWAPPIRHEDQWLDFHGSALALERRVRALHPRPSASTLLGGKRLKLLSVAVGPDLELAPGLVHVTRERRILVGTECGTLELLQVQPEGKRAMPVADWLNGRGITDGAKLGA